MQVPSTSSVRKMLVKSSGLKGLFPIFNESALIYLDSAATIQKPEQVIEAQASFLRNENANIHRGAYALSGGATERYERARDTVAGFINAKSSREIVFTSGTTASINIAAQALESEFKSGDVILLSLLEHHSNIVPWQLLAERRNLQIQFVGLRPDGQLDLDDYSRKVENLKPKLVAITAVSNVLGTVVPLKEVIERAHKQGALVLVDAAQAVAHQKVDVQALDADLLAFSGHKLYGPTGIGVLYGKAAVLEKMKPVFGGGGMISQVTQTGSTFVEAPHRFEAGTPPISEAIGLAEAITFVQSIGLEEIEIIERKLLEYAVQELSKEEGIRLYGPISTNAEAAQAGILAFTLNNVHAHDLASVADSFNICLRAGHHCAMPLHQVLGLQSTARISFGIYNSREDVDMLRRALREARKLFA